MGKRSKQSQRERRRHQKRKKRSRVKEVPPIACDVALAQSLSPVRTPTKKFASSMPISHSSPLLSTVSTPFDDCSTFHSEYFHPLHTFRYVPRAPCRRPPHVLPQRLFPWVHLRSLFYLTLADLTLGSKMQIQFSFQIGKK